MQCALPGSPESFISEGRFAEAAFAPNPSTDHSPPICGIPARQKASDDELCACGGKLDVRPSRHAAAVRAELRNASNRSDNESTSVRSRCCGSGHPVRVFHDIGCTLSWLPPSLYATCALGWLDCAASGRDHGTWPGKQCLTRLLEHCECLPDGERDAMMRLHAMTPALGAALRIHTLVAGVGAVRSKDLRQIGFHRAQERFNRVSSRDGRRIERFRSRDKQSATTH